MPTPQPEASFLAIITAWVSTAVVGLGAWAWLHTMGRIRRLEEDKMDRQEYERRADSSDQVREEIKESVRALTGKVDNFKDDVSQKFSEVKDLIIGLHK